MTYLNVCWEKKVYLQGPPVCLFGYQMVVKEYVSQKIFGLDFFFLSKMYNHYDSSNVLIWGQD